MRHWVSGTRLCEKIGGLIFKGRNDNEFQPLETTTLSRNVGLQSYNVVTSHSVRANTSTARLGSPNSCKSKGFGTYDTVGNKERSAQICL